jgi:hypothetical protein
MKLHFSPLLVGWEKPKSESAQKNQTLIDQKIDLI